MPTLSPPWAAINMLDELDLPEELVLNREPAAFLAHLERRLSRT